MGAEFQLVSDYGPQGDQEQAIAALVRGLEEGQKFQTLLGVTGSGKTFTVANAIARWGRPTLIMSPNKTLAAQLYGEFRGFFPHNAVEYFISYYDYYQPEAYIPSSDVYVEKDSSVNAEIDKLRLRATSALMERDDVIIVASVSAIYGLGSPEEYKGQLLLVELGEKVSRRDLLGKLVNIHYDRNDFEFARGTFRVRGDIVEIRPAYDDYGLRIELDFDEVSQISRFDLLTGEVTATLKRAAVYPAKHFITTPARLQDAMTAIRHEMLEQVGEFSAQGKLIEAQRIEQRTRFDLLFIGLWANIDNVFHILGPDFVTGKWVIFFIGLSSLLDMITGANGSILGTSKYYKVQTVFLLILGILLVITNLLLIPKLGIIGAAIGSAISLAILNSLRYLFLLYKYGLQPFNLRFVYVAIIGAGSYFISAQIPPFSNFIIDIFVRSTLLVVLFCTPVYFLKISGDLNAKADEILRKIKIKK